jgi:hypothetical protein
MLCRGETFNFSVINPQGACVVPGGRARAPICWAKSFPFPENLRRAGDLTRFLCYARLMDGFE